MGPFLVLTMDEQWSYRAAGLFCLIALVYTIVVLPESRMPAYCDKDTPPHSTVEDKPDIGTYVRDNGYEPIANNDSHINGSNDVDNATDGDNNENNLKSPKTNSNELSNASSSCCDCSGKTNPFAFCKYIRRSRLFLLISLDVFFSQISENGVIETALLYLKLKLGFTTIENVYLIACKMFNRCSVRVACAYFFRYVCESYSCGIRGYNGSVLLVPVAKLAHEYQNHNISRAFCQYDARVSLFHSIEEVDGVYDTWTGGCWIYSVSS